MKLGLMFFSSVDSSKDDKYGLLVRAARRADEGPFVAVWTPERHFHPFGGLFPNPAITTAAMATITRRIQLRAGSLIVPLHHEVRVAEDWSVIDNLSGGRIAISFGSGWNIDDFALWPDRYDHRRDLMFDQIQTIRHLWRGGTVDAKTPTGRPLAVRLHPAPMQTDLPVWITSSGDRRTFERAGSIGGNVLTHLIGQDLPSLVDKIEAYRRARVTAGVRGRGTISLMLHSFVGESDDEVRELVRRPFTDYLVSAISLEQAAAAGGGVVSGGRNLSTDDIPSDLVQELAEMSFERYYEHASLLGSPAKCIAFLRHLEQLGVDEIACLIDFGVADDLVLAGLESLAEVAGAVT